MRRAIQNSQESIAKLARRYNLNPATVAKWKRRDFVHDAKMGPKQPRSTSLSLAQEAMVVAFRKHTLLSLDDCLYALQATIPHLTRSSLHRCLQRHGISRLPEVQGDTPVKKKFKKYPIGYVHIDITEVQTEQGKLQLFVAMDRTCKLAYAELHTDKKKMTAVQFLRNVIAALPYKIHTLLTDNGAQFTHRKPDKPVRRHPFDRVCQEHDIEHRLTKINHPWTNGQVERMNRTIKEATVKRYHYRAHEPLKDHLQTFLKAYNFAKRLKALQGLTPYEKVIEGWHKEPEGFTVNPVHHTGGLYSVLVPGSSDTTDAQQFMVSRQRESRSATGPSPRFEAHVRPPS